MLVIYAVNTKMLCIEATVQLTSVAFLYSQHNGSNLNSRRAPVSRLLTEKNSLLLTHKQKPPVTSNNK